VTPIVVGLTLQVEALGGFLAGIIVSGQLLAVFLNNSGGAWDNAKKLIEDEPRSVQNNTGKGSERHKAGVVGDTVGDPFKDTAGPALNPMIKVVNLVSVIIAPIVVQYAGATGGTLWMVWIIALVLLGVLAWAVMRSKAPAPSMTEAKATAGTSKASH
jgi:K(+)-stimulated pyrophosphate-energized sodium pump